MATISKIKLPNNDTTYELRDASAIHTLSDIEALGLEGAFIFKGTVAAVSNLPTTGNRVGDVYHVTADDSEYVWTTSSEWEEFGKHIIVDHTHNVTVTGTNDSSSVSGSATVTGTNADSSVSASGSITVPKISKEANYIKASAENTTFVKSYPGATSKLAQTTVKSAGAAVTVIDTVTPSTGSITGVSGSTTASKATAGTAVAVAKAGTAVSIPNVTNKGSASTWSFNVDDDGLLIISGENGTAPTLGTAISVTPAVSNGDITPYTFADVTVPQAATAATTVVTGITTDTASVAGAGTDVTVATGSLASTGTGASVMTGLGTASTGSAITSVSLAEGTSTDGILVGDTVAVTSEDKTVSVTGTAAAQTWTQTTGTISGTAAAQTWTQKTGVTSQPV